MKWERRDNKKRKQREAMKLHGKSVQVLAQIDPRKRKRKSKK